MLETLKRSFSTKVKSEQLLAHHLEIIFIKDSVLI